MANTHVHRREDRRQRSAVRGSRDAFATRCTWRSPLAPPRSRSTQSPWARSGSAARAMARRSLLVARSGRFAPKLDRRETLRASQARLRDGGAAPCAPQKGQGAGSCVNAARSLVIRGASSASWGSQHPAACRGSRRVEPPRIRGGQIDADEFRCVRIISRETASRGPWVAPSWLQRYRSSNRVLVGLGLHISRERRFHAGSLDH